MPVIKVLPATTCTTWQRLSRGISHQAMFFAYDSLVFVLLASEQVTSRVDGLLELEERER